MVVREDRRHQCRVRRGPAPPAAPDRARAAELARDWRRGPSALLSEGWLRAKVGAERWDALLGELAELAGVAREEW